MSNQSNNSTSYIAAFTLLITVVAAAIADIKSTALKVVGVIAIFIITIAMGYTIGKSKKS
jgi:hypothetical protein